MGREEPSRPEVSERDRVDEEPFRCGHEACILELEKLRTFPSRCICSVGSSDWEFEHWQAHVRLRSCLGGSGAGG